MRDDRVRQLVTADVIAWQHRRLPLFIFKSDNARATYVFGRRVKQSGWIVDHPEPFRSAYKRYHKRVKHILREPTPFELYGMLPAFHPLERDGKPLTAGEYLDFTHKAWKAKQVADIVRLINQAEAQYIREDVNEINSDEDNNLVAHAKYELELAGMFNKTSDYGGMLGNAVLELVKVFAKQGHSGYSAHQTIAIFTEVANYRELSPIGKSPDEWVDQSKSSGEPMWQNKRRSTTFSRDGGKTWYDIDDPKLNNGDTWKKEKN